MTMQCWDSSLIGVDPSDHARSVLVVPGADTIVDHPALDELRRWGWEVTVADPSTDPVALEALALQHDVALFSDIRGTRAIRRALTGTLPTVAVVPPRGRGRITALVGSEAVASANERAAALAAVLLRAHAWHVAPVPVGAAA